MSASYAHSPLSSGQIRLAAVTKIDDDLSVSLHVIDFGAAPAYITLSYCWEGQVQDNVVMCDGRDLHVTQNVVAILNYLAITYPRHWFWIDAICIDQDNKAEKNVQVPLMRKIYERALRMVAWIGRKDEDIAATIQGQPNMFTKARDHVGEPIGRDEAYWRAYGILTRRPSVWFGLYKILLQPWFRRLWVIQEVILSKDVIFVCGESVVDACFLLPLIQEYSRFTLACITQVTLPTGDFYKGHSCFSNVCDLRKQWQAGTFQPHGLPELLSATEDFLVSNRRDRIYALLGITSSFWQYLVPVTYELPTLEVYINFATLWLAKRPQLLALNRASSRPPMEDLPSWCPVFDQKQIPWALGQTYLWSGYSAGTDEGKDGWTASRNIRAQDVEPSTSGIAVVLSSGARRHKLQLAGFQTGHVVSVVPPGSLMTVLNPEMDWHPNQFLKWEGKCLKISQSVYNLPNAVPPAHARTLVANKNMHHRARYSDGIFQAYEATMARLKSPSSWADDVDEDFMNYYPSIEFACYKRSFFSTSNGMIGVGPSRMEKDDVICIFDGCVTPFIIRLQPDSTDTYEFLGEAYVDGVMYGEALETEAAKNRMEISLI